MPIQTTERCDKCGGIVMDSLERMEVPSDPANPFSSRLILHRECVETALLPAGVPGNGVSQLVGAFSRRRR